MWNTSVLNFFTILKHHHLPFEFMKKNKKILSGSLFAVVALAFLFKYVLFFYGGLEQFIVIPVFIVVGSYLLFKRIYLLDKNITNLSFRLAIASDIIFGLIIIFVPVLADSGTYIWPGIPLPMKIYSLFVYSSLFLLGCAIILSYKSCSASEVINTLQVNQGA